MGGANSYTAIEGIDIGDEICYSIGGGLMAGIFIFLIFWTNYGQKKTKHFLLGKKVLIINGIIIGMTTVYFPWNDLSQMGGVVSFMIRNIQFPWRVSGLSIMLLVVLSLLIIKIYAGVDINKGKINELPAFSVGVLAENIERRYQRFVISCINETYSEGYIDLPLFYYKSWLCAGNPYIVDEGFI